jgi:hypothetical protein
MVPNLLIEQAQLPLSGRWNCAASFIPQDLLSMITLRLLCKQAVSEINKHHIHTKHVLFVMKLD